MTKKVILVSGGYGRLASELRTQGEKCEAFQKNCQ